MDKRLLVGITSVAVLLAVGTADAQVSNPVPEPIVTGELSVETRTLARLPDTRTVHADDRDPASFARVGYVRDIADGRRFANDTRGFL